MITAALWQSGRDQATVGGFVAFITALLQLIAPIKHLSEAAAPVTRGLAAIERGVDLLAHTPARGRRQLRPGPRPGPDRAARREPRLPRRQRQPGARPHQPDDRARRKRRPGRPLGRGQVDPGQPPAALPRADLGQRPARRQAAGRMERDGAAPADGAGEPGRLALQRQHRRQRRPRREHRPRAGARGRCAPPTCSSSPTACRRASTPSSATTPASSPAGSASAWRSPGRSTATRRS